MALTPLRPQDVERVLNNLRVQLVGASDSGIKLALFNTILEFLQDSNAWVENVELLVTAGTQTYTILPREGGRIIRLLGVWDGLLIPQAATMPNLGVLDVIATVTVTSVQQAATDTSRQATTPWRVTVVKNIDLPITKDEVPIAPAFVLNNYSNTIEAGVLGRMFMEPNKGYSSLELSKYHMKKFRDGIQVARVDAWTQNIVGGQRWTYPQGFQVGSQRGGVSTWPQVQ